MLYSTLSTIFSCGGAKVGNSSQEKGFGGSTPLTSTGISGSLNDNLTCLLIKNILSIFLGGISDRMVNPDKTSFSDGVFVFLCYTTLMETLIHADIFFLISTIILVIFGILGIIISIYITKIIIDIREISRIARNETSDISGDIHMIRREVHGELSRGSSVVVSIIKIIRGLFRRRKPRITKR